MTSKHIDNPMSFTRNKILYVGYSININGDISYVQSVLVKLWSTVSGAVMKNWRALYWELGSAGSRQRNA
jgi:hypothetical protein